MLKSLYNTIAPSLHGIGGVTLLGIVPDATTLHSFSQLLIIAFTAVMQIVHLCKKKPVVPTDAKL